MKLSLFLTLATVISGSTALAQMGVSVKLTETSENRSVVAIETRNGLGQDIRDARAWVFLFDASGKVVGQQAQWLGGGGALGDVESEPSSDRVLVTDGEEKTFSMALTARSQAVRAEITFSRIVLADGSLANIQRDVRPIEETALKN